MRPGDSCRPTCRATRIYRKVNPADAPILILALTSDTVDDGQDVRRGLHHPPAEALPGGGGRPGVRGGQLASGRPGGAEPDGAEQVRHQPGRCAGRAWPAPTSTGPRVSWQTQDKTWEIQTNDQLRTAAEYRPLIVTYRSGAAVRLPDVADVQDSVEDLRTAGSSTASRRSWWSSSASRAPISSKRSTGSGALLPQLEAAMPGGCDLFRSFRTGPRRSAAPCGTWSGPCSSPPPWSSWWCSAFLRNVRSTLIPARGGGGLPHRHLRGHVSLRLQPGQPLPHGPHHCHGVCGG